MLELGCGAVERQQVSSYVVVIELTKLLGRGAGVMEGHGKRRRESVGVYPVSVQEHECCGLVTRRLAVHGEEGRGAWRGAPHRSGADAAMLVEVVGAHEPAGVVEGEAWTMTVSRFDRGCCCCRCYQVRAAGQVAVFPVLSPLLAAPCRRVPALGDGMAADSTDRFRHMTTAGRRTLFVAARGHTAAVSPFLVVIDDREVGKGYGRHLVAAAETGVAPGKGSHTEGVHLEPHSAAPSPHAS